MSADLLAAVYTAAADDIENRSYVNFGGGRDAWSAIYQAVYGLIADPAIEGLRRCVKVEQVQWWDADQATVVKTLRDLAGGPEQLDVLAVADAENRVAAACRVLREGLGLTGETREGLYGLARYAADRITQAEGRAARLEAEIERLRAPYSPAEPVSPVSTPTGATGGAGEAQEARDEPA